MFDTESGVETGGDESTNLEEGGIDVGRESETIGETGEETGGGTDKEVETDKESVVESGKEADYETVEDSLLEAKSSDSERDSSLERHCVDYLAKKIGECLLV